MLTCKIDNFNLKTKEKDKRIKRDKIKSSQRRNREISKFMKKTKEKDKIEKEKKSWMNCWFRDYYKKKTKKKESREKRKKEKDKDCSR